MNSLESSWQVWTRDQDVCEQAIARGDEVEAVPTSYGHNDFVLHFLRDSKFWSVMTGMKADGLKRSNGKDPAALNGVEVIRELAGIERIQRCGKILQDTRVMLQAGFNLEEITKAKRTQRGVIDPETLSNHLARISVESAQNSFMEHLRLLRRRRWIRGGVYAADAHEIIVPYGRKFEQMGTIGAKHGFNPVILHQCHRGP